MLRRLGREGEADPRETPAFGAVVGALEDLIAARSGVLSKLEAAGEARGGGAKRAQPSVAGGAAAHDERRTAAMASLKARLMEARRDDSAARLRAARDEIDTTTRKLKEAFAALAPWRGNAEALALVAVPDEAETAELRRARREVRGASPAGRRSIWRPRLGEAERLQGRSRGRQRAARISSATRPRPRFARRARPRGWRIARRSTGQAPTLFEAAMRRDDAAGATRLAGARELAGLRERAVKLAGVEAERRACRGRPRNGGQVDRRARSRDRDDCAGCAAARTRRACLHRRMAG